MPTNRNLLIVSTLCLSALAACKADLASDVYVRDLQEVASGQESTLAAPAQITLGFPGSMQQCKDEAQSVTKFITHMFPGAAFAGCVETDGMENELRVDVDVAIRPNDADMSGGAALFIRDDGWLSMEIDRTALDRTLAQMTAENPMVSLDSFSATVNIRNDTRETVTVRAYQVFVNGAPVYDGTFDLERRGDLEIVLPDVGAALLRNGENFPVAQIKTGSS